MVTPAAQKKLIAFVSNSAWSVYNFRLDVIRTLLEQGYAIMVVAPNDDYSIYLRQTGCAFVPITFDSRVANPFADFRFFVRLKNIYAQYRPDFIFHFVAKPNIYGSLAASRVNIPSAAVVTGLGYAFAKRNWLYRLMKVLYRTSLKKAREVWFLNNEDARVFINEGLVNIEKVKVLPGEGVNTAYFSPDFNIPQKRAKKFTFLMSARLLKSKGVSLYADAARILKKKNYDLDFELLGFFEHNHPDSISRDDVARWQSEGLIHYRGFAKDVRPHLKSADCFVFPSYYNEGVPRCLMEAASMEVPIITSLNKGCKEVVLNNATGYLCNVNDPFDLADKMERMLSLPEEDRLRMGKNARALVIRKFDVSKVIDEYIDTLNRDIAD